MLWRLVRHDAPSRSVFAKSDRRERGERGTGRHCNVQQTHLPLAWRGAAPSLASWHLVMSGLRPHGVQGGRSLSRPVESGPGGSDNDSDMVNTLQRGSRKRLLQQLSARLFRCGRCRGSQTDIAWCKRAYLRLDCLLSASNSETTATDSSTTHGVRMPTWEKRSSSIAYLLDCSL